MSSFHILQAYFMGLYLAAILLRFFFSLKITRVFGPFSKLISINFFSLLTWALFTFSLILLMDNSLSTLLQEDQACDSLSSCGKVLIEEWWGEFSSPSWEITMQPTSLLLPSQLSWLQCSWTWWLLRSTTTTLRWWGRALSSNTKTYWTCDIPINWIHAMGTLHL